MIKKILLVDDDEDELELFMQSLENVPGAFSCTQANSGQHALQLLDDIQPDLIAFCKYFKDEDCAITGFETGIILAIIAKI